MSEDSTGDDELKTVRFNMFMSPNEMAAIEEWAWKNRIRSKSEAVRRLCQIGLEADTKLERVWQLLAERSPREANELIAIGALLKEAGDPDSLTKAFRQLVAAQVKSIEDTAILRREIHEMLSKAEAYRDGDKFEDAQKKVAELTAEFARLQRIITQGKGE